MSAVECFWVQPTDTIRRSLRRFSLADDPCPRQGYHNAKAAIEDLVVADSSREPTVTGDSWPHDDPRWPTACACGRPFEDGDRWQLFTERVYQRPDTLETSTLADLPPGAMYDAEWFKPGGAGDDGIALVVVLPDRTHWLVDTVREGRRIWARTGAPPRVTATPSIKTKGYHGNLREGVLSPC